MPAFGLLGIDFGHGFDPLPGESKQWMGNTLHNWSTILTINYILARYFLLTHDDLNMN